MYTISCARRVPRCLTPHSGLHSIEILPRRSVGLAESTLWGLSTSEPRTPIRLSQRSGQLDSGPFHSERHHDRVRGVADRPIESVGSGGGFGGGGRGCHRIRRCNQCVLPFRASTEFAERTDAQTSVVGRHIVALADRFGGGPRASPCPRSCYRGSRFVRAGCRGPKTVSVDVREIERKVATNRLIDMSKTSSYLIEI